MTMATAPVAPVSVRGSVRVVAVGDPSLLVRGRPAEFRHRGLTVVNRMTAVSALLELGRDPSAVVLVPSELDDFPVLPFVDVLRSVAHVPVIVGVSRDCSQQTLSDLAAHGVAATLQLPVTPTRLAHAVLATGTNDQAEQVALSIGELILDDACHRITWHGANVAVTPIQFALLRDLMLAYPRVLPMRELIDNFEDSTASPGVRTRVTIGRLRAALHAAAPDRMSPIETVHRIGYRLGL